MTTAIDSPVAIVTGGSRGIGRAVVEALARSGAIVHFTYVSNEACATQVARELTEQGQRAIASRVDACDRGAVTAFVQGVIERHGSLSLLVNNAAITRDRLLVRMSDEEWDAVLDTALGGMFAASRAAARQMMRQRSGRILNVSSVSALTGIAGQTNYAATKAAMLGFTRALAKELAGYGVCVNAIAPGFVDTDMLSGFSDAQRTDAIARVPMRRFGTTDEIAELVDYLGLRAPAYLTGQTLVVDGGLTS
jgi:3-oxoacyl-[acyl-carrier protein] reductase